MERYNKILLLSEDEIKRLSIYLAYGVGIGILIGMFTENIDLYFSLGGVISILLSLVVCFVKRKS